ncbi:MAG TPA: hypothetical protein VKZ58_08490 [Longimicrobiales bacterium]|nr:hypothetical protein [Longimicrobiales bacterium]
MVVIRDTVGPVARILGALAAVVFAACGDSTTSPATTPPAEYAVVLNSVDRSLTAFPVDAPEDAFTLGLGPDGSPVSLAARAGRVAVPMGSMPAVVVVDLAARRITHTIALPEGSGATGVAFLNDSIAVVANSGLNTVHAINVVRGTRVQEVAVGVFPQAVVAVSDTAYVVNARLGPDFLPAGPGTISVVTGAPLQVVRTIELTGENPGDAAPGAGGRLFVLFSGSFGAANGAVSVIDRGTLAETSHHGGFGEFPGSVEAGPDGRLYVSSFAYGIAVWDPAGDTFVRPPENAVAPGGTPSTAGLGFDSKGRLYALEPVCTGPGRALRLAAGTFAVEAEVQVGTCPIAIAFTEVAADS